MFGHFLWLFYSKIFFGRCEFSHSKKNFQHLLSAVFDLSPLNLLAKVIHILQIIGIIIFCDVGFLASTLCMKSGEKAERDRASYVVQCVGPAGRRSTRFSSHRLCIREKTNGLISSPKQVGPMRTLCLILRARGRRSGGK